MAKSLPTVSDMIEAILDILLSGNLPVEHWNKEGTQQRWAELTQMREKLSSQPIESQGLINVAV